MPDSTNPRRAALALADPKTPAKTLAMIAGKHRELWPQVAGHPNVYPQLLDYLDSHGDTLTRRAVAAHRHVAAPSFSKVAETTNPRRFEAPRHGSRSLLTRSPAGGVGWALGLGLVGLAGVSAALVAHQVSDGVYFGAAAAVAQLMLLGLVLGVSCHLVVRPGSLARILGWVQGVGFAVLLAFAQSMWTPGAAAAMAGQAPAVPLPAVLPLGALTLATLGGVAAVAAGKLSAADKLRAAPVVSAVVAGLGLLELGYAFGYQSVAFPVGYTGFLKAFALAAGFAATVWVCGCCLPDTGWQGLLVLPPQSRNAFAAASAACVVGAVLLGVAEPVSFAWLLPVVGSAGGVLALIGRPAGVPLHLIGAAGTAVYFTVWALPNAFAPDAGPVNVLAGAFALASIAAAAWSARHAQEALGRAQPSTPASNSTGRISLFDAIILPCDAGLIVLGGVLFAAQIQSLLASGFQIASVVALAIWAIPVALGAASAKQVLSGSPRRSGLDVGAVILAGLIVLCSLAGLLVSVA
ncbi:MAG: hypothetical protein LBR58_07630 [Propionibacteriaceae bacterium]|jgi:hypothetical protein|nr:hypothetical protein [Propionibacteriaceae bacterium]